MIDELLHIAWPRGVPERLHRLVDRPLCASLLRDFKLGLILTHEGGGEVGPTRLALSDQGEDERWRQLVLQQWPSSVASGFLAQADPAIRRMVDSDGSDRAVLYLDDLQTAPHRLAPPAPLQPLELMCATLSLPQKQRGWLTRHKELPLGSLHGALAERARELRSLGAQGLWSLRWGATDPEGLLWITESRWRDNADTANRTLLRLLQAEEAPDRTAATIAALKACVTQRGHHSYPDVVELRADGTTDITLGFL